MKNYLIIGNSAAGISGVSAIRKRDTESKITVVSDEEYPSYCRCLISYYLAGEVKKENIFYRPERFYKENNTEVLLGEKVLRVEPKKNQIICEDKSRLDYDALLIAAGASPKFPEIKGIKKNGVFGFRTFKDAKNIQDLLAVTKTACVLGGGLVGLKAAAALKKRNIEVKVIVKSKQILSQVLDEQAACFVQKRLEEHGVEMILGQDVVEIIGNGDVKAVKLDSGKVIAASLIIAAKGVEPNTAIAKDTDIKINTGIISDKHLTTNIPNIYTAGDCAESLDLVLGEYTINALWSVAVEQGRIAGANMAGDSINYEGSLGMNSLEFFGLPTVSLGDFKPKADKAIEEIKISNPGLNIYKKLVIRNNLLVGAVLAGDIKNSGIFLRLIKEKIEVSAFKHKLLEDNFGFADIAEFVREKEQIFL